MKSYDQHSGKVIETDGKFKHVMAIALDQTTNYREGIARCIVSREGDLGKRGYIDRSEIYRISGTNLEQFKLDEPIMIAHKDEVLKSLAQDGYEFIGLEDPDIFIDPATGLTHIYFTLPFIGGEERGNLIHLGHAVGKDLDSLTMTLPVLQETPETESAKEISIAPINSQGVRLNLFESGKKEKDFDYSVVRVAKVTDMGAPWEFGDIVFHPKEHGIAWIGGHASPGPLFPKSFLDIGGTKLVGIMNGREANKRVGKEIVYGHFDIGLFIYDYETGKIDWVSPEYFIRDSEARIITFASQFIETGKGEGILYAHVDDSFVRAYTLYAEGILALVPNEFISR